MRPQWGLVPAEGEGKNVVVTCLHNRQEVIKVYEISRG